MIFSLDVRRARQGDCLLLHFGSQAEPGLVMIDGGPASVYARHLKPRLLEIKRARHLDDQEPLPVDLLMVSHADDDHIQGILDLTREIIAANRAPLVRVLSFWHNSFDDIIGQEPAELSAAGATQFGTASLDGGLPADLTVDPDQPEESIADNLRVLASIEQGHRLRGEAGRLEFPLNPDFDGELILAGEKEFKVADGLTFIVAGPMEPELMRLRKKHQDWLQAHPAKKTGAAALAAYLDRAVSNLSSIVVLAKFADKRMLLTGDARGDKILEGLELAGLLSPGGTMHVNVLKVPHHGSSNNLEDDFFKRVIADHYVFSGNGEHGNPERETFEMLWRARGQEPFEVHLTYPVEEIDRAREQAWKKEQAKDKKRGAKEPRADWEPATQSLSALFDQTKLSPGQTLHIAGAKEPHVIDLLDPLGY